MAFQDFDLIQQRRKAERRQKLKKRIIIGAVSIIVLAAVIGAAVFVVITKSDEHNNNNSNSHKKGSQSSPSKPPGRKEMSSGQKMVKLVCSSTDYKNKCESTLTKSVQADPNATQPKDLLRFAFRAAEDEVDKAFVKVKSMKFETEQTKGALEDCKQLIDDAKEELGSCITSVTDNDLKKISENVPDLNNWLSAIMSYPETCVDGFPEGKLKTDIKKAFQDTKELVSISLAMLSGLTSSHSTLQNASTARHLLSSPDASLDKTHDLPTWMGHEDRRMLKAADDKPMPNVTVAKDGSGQFKTISEALAKFPARFEGRYVIYVKEGIYEETVTITKYMANLTMYGDGSQKTIITGRKNFVDGVRTFQTATFVVLGEGFLGKAMGFRNTAGPEKHQAVAARVQADRVVFVNCRFEGFQDTLYVQTHRQFYRSCVISGTIDFIFGDAAAVFQNCIIFLRKPLDNQKNTVTAQGRTDKRETTGIVLQKCDIKADDQLVSVKDKIKCYLGRPWKEFSRTIVMESSIGDIISPDGWLPWEGEFALKTLSYAEYGNTGAGSSTSARVKWPGYKVISKQDASKFTVEAFLQGTWIRGLGIPAQMGFYN